VLYNWPRILGPEADGVHMLRFQAEPGNLPAVKGVDPVKVSRSNPVHEPVGIEGRYVGASAGGDNHDLPRPLDGISEIVPAFCQAGNGTIAEVKTAEALLQTQEGFLW